MSFTPPGFHDPDLYQVNINRYKRNKTRKNIKRNLSHKGNTIYYLDIGGKIEYSNPNTGEKILYPTPPKNTPRWFSKWESVPENSMDMIWSQHCPAQHPFWTEEFNLHLQHFEEPSHIPFLDPVGSSDDIWRDLLIHGKRILKPGGKIVIPIPIDVFL